MVFYSGTLIFVSLALQSRRVVLSIHINYLGSKYFWSNLVLLQKLTIMKKLLAVFILTICISAGTITAQ